MVTRQHSQRRDLEAKDDQRSGLSNLKETESKLVNFQSLLWKLAYFNRATDGILRGNSKEAIIRQQTTKVSEAYGPYGLIELIQCMKIDAGESDEPINECTSENNGILREYEAAIEELNHKLSDEEKTQREIERQDKIRQEVEARALIRYEEEQAELAKRLREEKFALSLEEKKLDIASAKRIKTKFLDLQISKFQGSHLDWVRFWGLFETQIDKAPMNDDAKFAYLKEHVVPKVRVRIDKLPLSTEGYAKAKKERYGDTSEVVNAHIQEIISLPTINGASKQRYITFMTIL